MDDVLEAISFIGYAKHKFKTVLESVF